MRILGIDPGKSGAATLIDQTGEILCTVRFDKETEHDIAEAFREFFEDTKNFWNDKDDKLFAFLEQVHAFPKQGVSSTFKFGASYGFLKGVLVALHSSSPSVTRTRISSMVRPSIV